MPAFRLLICVYGRRYIVSTEDGDVHKCSCSYSEQYLENYFSHSGPVFRARWSPFAPQYFATSSADCTVQLWNHERATPIVSMKGSQVRWVLRNSDLSLRSARPLV